MLRPATPLSILYLIAFVLLLLATISTPIIRAIPIATVQGVNFGVLGYCEPDPKGCTGINVGYTVDAKELFGNDGDNSQFSLPLGTRSSLSSILIVHPVAALFTLVCFILSVGAHFHGPSHSSRYLIFVLIASIPTLLITLLAFLVDILLFVPHLAWGGWLVLAATILILASGIVTCAMRRTLVSRKESKKRIAENADMNGETFYANQNPIPQGVRADSPPPLSTAPTAPSDKLPSYAAFEKKVSEEDRIPLNTRTPSNKTLNSAPSTRGTGQVDNRPERYGVPPRGGPMGMRGGRGGLGGPKDEYGNPLPPSNAFGPAPPMGMRRDRSEPPMPMRRQYSDESMNSYGSRGGRGRGGYPPRGYGRGRPYGPGPGPGRGGFGRGQMGPPPGRGPPPPGYGNSFAPQNRPDQYEGAGFAGYGRSPSAPGYGRRNYSPGPPSAPGGHDRQSPGPPSAPGGYNDGYNRAPSRGQASDPGGYNYDRQNMYNDPPPQPYRRQSPPQPPLAPPSDLGMIGQAVEMDARHGSPGANPNQLRDSDSDVRGFVGLQQQQKQRDSPMSMTSVYSSNDGTYVPPRAAWKGNPQSSSPEPPTNFIQMDSATSSTTQDPIELPEQNTLRKTRSPTGPSKLNAVAHGRKQSSDDYYEDVDPRFAAPPPSRVTPQQTQPSGPMPTALVPGQLHAQEQTAELVDPTSSYEDLDDGQRSPASDHSNMTSISQRGVNPNWHPGEPHQQGGRLGVPGGRKPVPPQPQRDAYFQSVPPYGEPPISNQARGASPPVVVPPITQHGQAF